MLKLLADYAHSHGLEVEPGFKPKVVRWAIVFDPDFRFLDVVELGDASLKKNPGRTFPKCPDLSQPEMVAGGESRSHFLVETVEVVALYGKNADDLKTQKKHAYFLKLLEEAEKSMSQLTHLAARFSAPDVLAAINVRLEAQRAGAGDKATFKVGEDYPVDSDLWHDWWREFRRKLGGGGAKLGGAPMRCFVTGRLAEPAPTHPKIEKLADVGGQPSGDALICFDKEAFRSYGLEQSANAAVSEVAVSAYRAGLNHLIKENGRRLAGAKVVHWFKDKVTPADDPFSWLEESREQEELDAQHRVKNLLESIKSGKRADLAHNRFYALTLSGAGGRVMVRDWMEGQFEDLAENISIWFEDLSIVYRDGEMPRSGPKFLAVLGATVRDLNDLAAPFVAKMWRVAVRGEPIPRSALAQALERVRVDVVRDEPVRHAAMGLMKAYHVRKHRKEGGEAMASALTPFLNEDHPEKAYQCGRLMAVLAEVQRRALGDVGAGVVQRYYAAASTTPALVLGRLTRTSQFHLNKLDPGLARWYESRIAGIWGAIRDNVPPTLTLEEQSLFALGYYQQMAQMRTPKGNKQDSDKGEE
ncbi:MAG: type I-C CRISPR-associated protein Cas8c/Csd1 [Chloroflexi bacterium]|nr:type I-C CRISPR-associated protein Cas8c/Csd1 [Chloroflexota bacterium]